MQSILAMAEQQAHAAGATHIHQIRVRIGQLSGVVADSLQYAFEVLRTGTPAADAQLCLETVPAACWCDTCQQEFPSPELGWNCPRCGSPSRELRHGRELELASMEVS